MKINKNKVLIIIPARSGSKRVKNKNIKKLGNMPLLGHKIKSCLKAKIGGVLVSTNSKKIAKYSKKLGADTPFLRPKKLSTSKSSTMACILHAIRYLIEYKKNLPEYIAVLPATNPFLKTKSILTAYKKIKVNKKYNSIISYTNSSEHPFLVVQIKKKLIFNSIKVNKLKYSDFERTQDWPEINTSSAALKISKTKFFLKFIKDKSANINKKTFDMNSCIGIKISNKEAFDINNHNDFRIAQAIKNIK